MGNTMITTIQNGYKLLDDFQNDGSSGKFFRHDKDVVSYEAACCGRGISEREKKKGHGGVRVW